MKNAMKFCSLLVVLILSLVSFNNITMLAEAAEIELISGQPQHGFVESGEQKIYKITIPGEATSLTVETRGTIDDALDLFVKWEGIPTVSEYDEGSNAMTGDETVIVDGLSHPALQGGTYYILVDGWDGGNYNITATVEMGGNVEDLTPPTTSITSPANGATVGDIVMVEATAQDNVEVAKVRFYVDGIYKEQDTTAPYQYQWDTSAQGDGIHLLKVYAYDALSGGNSGFDEITVTVNNNGIEENEEEGENVRDLLLDSIYQGSLMATGGKDYFKLEDFNQADQLDVLLDGPDNADFDLYVKKDELPSTSNYDARGFSNSADESCTISNPSGTYYIMIKCYSGTGQYSLLAGVAGDGNENNEAEEEVEEEVEDNSPEDNNGEVTLFELTLGETLSESVVNSGSKLYFVVEVADGFDELTVVLDGPDSNADFDLYIKDGEVPATNDYDQRGFTNSADETVTIRDHWYNGLAGTYYIMVHGYMGTGPFTLSANAITEQEAEEGGEENNGEDTGEEEPGENNGEDSGDENEGNEEGETPENDNGENDADEEDSGGENEENDEGGEGEEPQVNQTLEPNKDEDNDGLKNGMEEELGTDPYNPDTDGDGFWDGVEVFDMHWDPNEKLFNEETTNKPWSGYWWPLADTNDGGSNINNLYDEGGPLDKYDQYVNATRGYHPGARDWEFKNNRYVRQTLREKYAEQDYQKDFNGDGDMEDSYDVNHDGDTEDETDASWWGHCHAWAPASSSEIEPTEAITYGNITFTPGDLKGLLVACYDRSSTTLWVGSRYDAFEKVDGKLPRYDSSGDDVMDITPEELHTTLINNIGRDDAAIVADVVATGPVWNYPAYKYHISMRDDEDNADTKHVTTEVWYVTDGVGIDFVGSSVFSETYYYTLNFSLGKIVESEWKGSSLKYNSFEKCHPDFLWRSDNPSVDWGNPLKYEIVKEIINGESFWDEMSDSRSNDRRSDGGEGNPRGIATDAPDADFLNQFPSYHTDSSNNNEDGPELIFVSSGPEEGTIEMLSDAGELDDEDEGADMTQGMDNSPKTKKAEPKPESQWHYPTTNGGSNTRPGKMDEDGQGAQKEDGNALEVESEIWDSKLISYVAIGFCSMALIVISVNIVIKRRRYRNKLNEFSGSGESKRATRGGRGNISSRRHNTRPCRIVSSSNGKHRGMENRGKRPPRIVAVKVKQIKPIRKN